MEKILYDILIEEYRKANKDRVDNKIHVSNLIDFCPREYALSLKHDVPYNKPESVTLAQLITYELGNLIHISVRSKLRTGGVLLDLPCMEYKDYKNVPIIGHPDAYVKLSRPTPVKIIEIKSMGKEEFDTLSEPVVKDHCQLSLYLWLADNTSTVMQTNSTEVYTVDAAHGFLVYFCKLYKPIPIKVFYVQRNDDFIKRNVLPRIKQVKSFSLKGTMPKRMCNSPIAMMARTCTMKTECFDEPKKK